MDYYDWFWKMISRCGSLIAAGFMFYSCSVQEPECLDEDQINPEAICTMDYTPVCGCDNSTYGNSCQAEAAGLLHWEDGACQD